MAITLLQPFNLDSTKDFTFSTVNVTNTTSSTDSTTGSLVVAGGVGIAGNVNIATNLTVNALSNLGNVGNVKITGGSSGQFLQTDGAGNIVWATVNSTVIFNGTSNVSVPTANGNVSISVNGTSNVVIVGNTGVNVNGYVAATKFSSNIATGTAPFEVFSTTRVSNLNVSYANVSDYSNVIIRTTGVYYPTFIDDAVSGNYRISSNANLTYNVGTQTLTAANIEGTIRTASQPYITSVGNLTDLIVTGNVDANTVNISESLYVDGNVYAPFFIGDVTGTVYGTVISGTISAPGSNTEILFNDTGNLGASPSFTFDKSTNTLSVLNKIESNYVSVGHNLDVTANIEGGNITANTSLSVGGNATITGNLTVNGTTIYANVTTVTIKDPIIALGGDTTGAPLVSDDNKDRGLILHYHNGINPVDGFVGWDDSAGEFIFGKDTSVSGEVISVNEYGNVRANNFYGNFSGTVTGTVSGTISLPAGGNTGLVFNDSGEANSSSALTFDKTTNVLTLTGNLTSNNANLGNLVTANYITGTLTTNAQPNITSLGTLASLTVTSNITSGNANLGNLATANYFSGTLTTNAQPNVTSLGTLANLSIAGNVTSGNANLGNLATANYFTGVLTTNAQPNITSLGTLSSLSIAGNLTSGNANLGNLATANYFTGTLTTNAQPNITSLGTLANLTVTGNIVSGNANLGNLVTANFFSGDGGLLSNINTAAIGVVANANYAAYAGNVVIGNQSNITSLGNLTSLRVTGNLRFDTGLSVNGNFGNIGQVLTARGDNTVAWSNQFYVGNLPPQLLTPAITPNYGDIWYYVDNLASPPIEKLYMWVNDGTSSYYYDFLPPGA